MLDYVNAQYHYSCIYLSIAIDIQPVYAFIPLLSRNLQMNKYNQIR